MALDELVETKIAILGKEYPVKSFEDGSYKTGEKRYSTFPYCTLDGVDRAIILSSMVIIKKDDKYLLVEEIDKGLGGRNDSGKISFPGGGCDFRNGRLDSFEETAIREALDEADVHVKLDGILGVYSRINKRGRLVYKSVFYASIVKPGEGHIDVDVQNNPLWLDASTIQSSVKRHKTSDVSTILSDSLAGIRYSLDMINSPEVIKRLPDEI